MTDPTLQTHKTMSAGTSNKKQEEKTQTKTKKKSFTKKEVEDHLAAQELSEAPIKTSEKIENLLDDTPKVETEKLKVAQTHEELRFAIGKAQLSKIGWVEVSAELFEKLLNGTSSPYIIMSGVKVYLEGTRESLEKQDSKATF